VKRFLLLWLLPVALVAGFAIAPLATGARTLILRDVLKTHLALRAYLGPDASAARQARAANVMLLTYTLLFALPFLAIQGLSLTVFLIAGGYLALAFRWPGIETAGALGAVAEPESAPSRARAA